MAREQELNQGPQPGLRLEYLKHAVYGLVTARTEAERLPLLSVVATMLHFSPEELERAKGVVQGSSGPGLITGVVGGWLGSRLGGVGDNGGPR